MGAKEHTMHNTTPPEPSDYGYCGFEDWDDFNEQMDEMEREAKAAGED